MITSVALVKPKAGVFIDEIAWLLVICTPISVLLLGVSSSPAVSPNHRSRQEIKLYATDMSIPTEVEMTSVIGTNEGRIFMVGAQDGNLYELHYQEKEGWFEKRVQLINHSVGGVQSFLPLLNTSKTSGMSGVITYFPHTYTIQTVSFLLYPTSLGISSTHYRVTTRYPSTNRPATERCNTIKPLRTYIRRRKTKHLAALLSHHRPGISSLYTSSNPADHRTDLT